MPTRTPNAMDDPSRGMVLLVLVCCWCGLGCSRLGYVHRADRDAYSSLNHYSKIDSSSSPTDLSVVPSPLSRLFDPTPVDAPVLADPLPRLHSYEIPNEIGTLSDLSTELQGATDGEPHVTLADNQDTAGRTLASSRRNGRIHSAATSLDSSIVLTRLTFQEEIPVPSDEFAITPLNIPQSAWEAVPPECRVRIFEFPDIREEYEKSIGHPPPLEERDPARRLSLPDILQLALLNSREYQAQKEQLYRVALRLSLEEYDYLLKFAPFGNGTGLRYENRSNNIDSQSTLAVPSQAQLEALLGTGTNLVARFANDVLLTFNGPDGFAADIGSEMLLELTHSVFQNDIRFENLTQAERNVVYAARDFARFRRTFYFQLASQYYNLLRLYRQVEIDAQNYLSLVRVYGQREVEFAEGEVARIQIDQVEQNMLEARSNLISNCNALEFALDQLKLRLGLPTETPMQLDLTELQWITHSDHRLARLELVKRVVGRLNTEIAREPVDEVALLSLASELVSRMQEAAKLTQSLAAEQPSQPAADHGQLERYALLLAYLQTAEPRAISSRLLRQLKVDQADPNAPAIRVPELARVYVRSVLSLLKQEMVLARTLSASRESVQEIEARLKQLDEELEAYELLLDEALSGIHLQQLADLRRQADQLAEQAAGAAKFAHDNHAQLANWEELGIDDSVDQTARNVLNEAHALLAAADGKLPPIDIDFDSASQAAVIQRLDLANARGVMFDEWRGSKLAADELKSILVLQARQRLISQNQVSRPFELDFDESRTELSALIDTPLNRRAQRNAFREQLLNYQLARRDVMALEDAIKLDIRNDLRSIRLSREQHSLGIASAALAFERVISTELQLRLGVAGVAARDYLESQTAYANALSTVAARRIDYIKARISLFTNLEQLQLDAQGEWAGLNDPNWLPEIVEEESLWQGYGELPTGLHYSKELRVRSQQFWSPPIQPVPAQ